MNDSAAIGAMGTLRDHGLTVGRDLALVGYNDIAIARDLPISLSSVRTPLREMGETAARLLVAKLEGTPANPSCSIPGWWSASQAPPSFRPSLDELDEQERDVVVPPGGRGGVLQEGVGDLVHGLVGRRSERPASSVVVSSMSVPGTSTRPSV